MGEMPDEDGEWDLWLERPALEDPAEPVAVPSNHIKLPVGSWSTPVVDKENLPPCCRIQRRIPRRQFQVWNLLAEPKYSKTFTWAAEGSPSMKEQFDNALAWAWKEYADHT